MQIATPGPLRVVGGHLAMFRRLWRLNLLSSFVQPMLYLLGLGVGVGALVDRNAGSTQTLGGISYVAFVAPGLMATTAMALCASESMWPVMAGLKWRRDYFGIAATPLGATDIVVGHVIWMAARAGIAGLAVAAALVFVDDTRGWGLLPAVLVSMFVGVSFAMPIMAYSVGAELDGGFPAILRFVIIPLFLFGGAFYPLAQLPDAVQWLARAFPLWHGVVVARGFTTGSIDWVGVAGHLAYIVLWTVVGAAVSIARLSRRLYP